MNIKVIARQSSDVFSETPCTHPAGIALASSRCLWYLAVCLCVYTSCPYCSGFKALLVMSSCVPVKRVVVIVDVSVKSVKKSKRSWTVTLNQQQQRLDDEDDNDDDAALSLLRLYTLHHFILCRKPIFEIYCFSYSLKSGFNPFVRALSFLNLFSANAIVFQLT